jgi:hypothetical protein
LGFPGNRRQKSLPRSWMRWICKNRPESSWFQQAVRC